MRLLGPLEPSRFFGEAFREIDANAREEALEGVALDRARMRTLAALVLGSAVLTLLDYYGNHGTFGRLCRAHPALAPLQQSEFAELWGYVWWSGTHVLGYFVVPALVARFVFDLPLREQGLALAGTRNKLGLYGLLFALVLPVIVGASFLGDFAQYYPFYKQSSRSWFDLLAWELLYVLQFFALEYFFRGFLLQMCWPTMGSSAIFCMLAPYCMIHFGKPVLEALAAIFAGLVLGTLALRTRSIWGGVMIHVGVALTMDVAALWQRSGLPRPWWPDG